MLPQYHYAIQFSIAIIAAYVMRIWGNEICGTEYIFCQPYESVYILMSGYVVYHTVMIIILLICASFKEEFYFKSAHTEWFLWKYITLLYFLMYSFVPASSITTNDFEYASHIYLTMAIIYLFIQGLLLYGCSARQIRELLEWVYLKGGDASIIRWILLIILLLYIGCYAALFCMVRFMSGNEYIATAAGIMIVIISYISLTKSTRDANSADGGVGNMGLGQAVTISTYSVFILLTAMNSQPLGLDTEIIWQVLFVVGMIFAFWILAHTIAKDTSVRECVFLHFVHILAAFYSAALLTNWSISHNSEHSELVFWMQIVSAFFMYIIFIGHACLPIVFS